MKQRISLLLILFIALFFIYGKKPNGKIIDKPLEWKDFRGKAPKKAHFKALTYTTIYLNPISQGEHPKFEVLLYFSTKDSWVSKSFLKKADENASKDLLKHEQGHYDIARIITWELDKSINSFVYDKRRGRYQADSIYRSYLKKMRDTQRKYDDETNHSVVVTEQQRWNNIIAEALVKKSLNL